MQKVDHGFFTEYCSQNSNLYIAVLGVFTEVTRYMSNYKVADLIHHNYCCTLGVFRMPEAFVI